MRRSTVIYLLLFVAMAGAYYYLNNRPQPADITVTVEPDTEPRLIEIPAELKKAFRGEKEVKAFFDKLSYTHQKEYVNWINEAKQEKTRQTRVAKTVELLKQGKKGK